MKKLFLLIPVLTILFFACKKKNEPAQENTPSEPIVTEKGTAIGTASSTIIGSAGGELTNADGSVRIVVPAGALQNNTTVSIQPITNTLYESDDTKLAYRLSPEGTNFLKPVTVVFKYTEDDFELTTEDLMTIAFQQQNGTWKVVPSILNKQNKTLTIETTHFSDWTKTGGFEMAISETTIKQGEQTKVYVKSVDQDGEMGNLGISAADLEGLTSVGNWEIVQGGGTLDMQTSSYKGFVFRGTYKAPTNITSTVIATLRMEVRGFNKIKDPSQPGGVRNTGHMILFGDITVVTDGYVRGNMGSINFDFYSPNITAHVMGNLIQIIGGNDEYRISLAAFGNAAGTYTMGDITIGGKGWVVFDKTSGTLQSYTSGYYSCGPYAESVFSTAKLFIDELPPVGGYIKGAFHGPLHRVTGNCGPEPHDVNVTFSVLRTR